MSWNIILAECLSGVDLSPVGQKSAYSISARGEELRSWKSAVIRERCCKSRTCWSSYVSRKNKPKRSSVKWIVRQHNRVKISSVPRVHSWGSDDREGFKTRNSVKAEVSGSISSFSFALLLVLIDLCFCCSERSGICKPMHRKICWLRSEKYLKRKRNRKQQHSSQFYLEMENPIESNATVN